MAGLLLALSAVILKLSLFQRGGLIGSGGFGKVYLGMNLETGELIAVKQIPVGCSSETRKEVPNSK